MAHIEMERVSKVYRTGNLSVAAVDNISLSVERGDFMSIVGPSGSGKTTLISMIGAITRPSSGRILYEGSDLCLMDDRNRSRYRNRKIGFIFQFASLLPALTVRDNVLAPTFFNFDDCSPGKGAAERYLDMVGLGDKLDCYPSRLSGGQQRRVAIARALINNPEVIIADEPTGDLDEETERDVLGIFKYLNREMKITLILVTHNKALAEEGSRTLHIVKGGISGPV